MYNHNILNTIILKIVKQDVYKVYKLALLSKRINSMVRRMTRHRKYLLYKKIRVIKRSEPKNLFLAIKNGYDDLVDNIEGNIDLEKTITPIFFGRRKIGFEALRYAILWNRKKYIDRYEAKYDMFGCVEKLSASLVSGNQFLVDEYYKEYLHRITKSILEI